MNIALINGSPKIKDSASKELLLELKKLLNNENFKIIEHDFRRPMLNIIEMKQLISYDVIVFAFPLYVDGIPSHFLNCLIQLEDFVKKSIKKKSTIYAIANCGFYEGFQNKVALEIMENWCIRTDLRWGQGVGVGGGPMFLGLKNVPSDKGPKKKVNKVLKILASNIIGLATGKNIYISPSIPRFLYKFFGEIGWSRDIKKNGLKKKDLFLKK